jgi:hypothetical protein
MNLREADIEEYLWQNCHLLHWKDGEDKGVGVGHWLARQFPVPSGIIDLLADCYDDNLGVIEVKLGPITSAAIAQVCRYAYDIESVVRLTNWEGMKVHRVVVGSNIDKQTLFECKAIGVVPITYSAFLSLWLQPQDWGTTERGEIMRQYLNVIDSEVFRKFIVKRQLLEEWQEKQRQAEIDGTDDELQKFIDTLEELAARMEK